MPQAGARSIFGGGVDGEAGGGEAERNRGQAGTAARLAVGCGSGRRMRVITSLESGWRGGCMPEGTCDCVGNTRSRANGGHFLTQD